MNQLFAWILSFVIFFLLFLPCSYLLSLINPPEAVRIGLGLFMGFALMTIILNIIDPMQY